MRRILRVLIPEALRRMRREHIKRLNAERWQVEKFLEAAAGRVKLTDRVLDAGAGNREYSGLFSGFKYESTDIAVGINRPGDHHAYICELDHMPVRDQTYDAIVNTQVLEHVEYPQRVVDELARALKPDGQLFLTTPQSWGVHMAPYHFYNFTRYGLESLFRNAGFEILSITPIGGIFWNLAKITSKLPEYITKEYRGRGNGWALVALYPFYLLLKPLCEIAIPFFFFYFDRIDLNRGWTIGYMCHCRKPSIDQQPSSKTTN